MQSTALASDNTKVNTQGVQSEEAYNPMEEKNKQIDDK